MLSVLVESTNFSEANLCIFNTLNDAVRSIAETNLIYVNLSAQVTIADFAIMNLTELNNVCGGTVIATCLMTADCLSKAPINCKKAYYMWDLSFLLRAFDFEQVYRTLSGLHLITRSASHHEIVHNIFGLPSTVVPTFSLEQTCNSLS